MLFTKTSGHLEARVYETREALGRAAARDAVEALQQTLSSQGFCNIIFAAAPSQNEFLAALCESGIDWSRVNAFHMDEYLGLAEQAPQRFGNFLRRAIFDKLPFRSVHFIDGNADPQQEIARYGALLQENRPDIIFMGIGENGHIAFNDPHVCHFDDPSPMRIVDLDETCRQQQVNDGCFASLEEVPLRALTLTPPTLVSARRIFCMVPAATKAQAVEATVYGEIREMVPATILRMHPQATLYLDSDSGRSLLERK